MSLVKCRTIDCPYNVREGLRRSGYSPTGVELADGRFCWRCRARYARWTRRDERKRKQRTERRAATLTEADWETVFKLRCKSKRGEHLSQQELRLCEAAIKADPRRYERMGVDVFNATVPFGSNVRAKARTKTKRAPTPSRKR